MHALTVAGATRRFGAVQALDGASFDLAGGEMLALLGPNGAGKTTLIRAIAGRLALDSGEVRVFGTPVRPRHTAADLGIVPQEIALYPLMTARENLHAFGALLGLSGTTLRERVAWALDRTALADRASDLVRGFSGGMKRRLNIAAGVLHRPRVVLLDEPTAGVDPQSRDRIYDMLAELAADGVSLLVTTHHLEEAEARCSRIVIIDHGKVVASGTLAELVDQTVGRHRTVSLRVDRDIRSLGDAGAPLLTLMDANDGRIVRTRLRDVATELPPLLARVAAAGLVVEDVDVRGPSLQAVFIHLTGRELRD